MMAPSVPGALLTPIAPQSLSFRPLIVPESSLIEIRLPFGSRSHARSGCARKLRAARLLEVVVLTPVHPQGQLRRQASAQGAAGLHDALLDQLLRPAHGQPGQGGGGVVPGHRTGAQCTLHEQPHVLSRK